MSFLWFTHTDFTHTVFTHIGVHVQAFGTRGGPIQPRQVRYLARLEMLCPVLQPLTSRDTNPFMSSGALLDPPGNASCVWRSPHIQAHQPPLSARQAVRADAGEHRQPLPLGISLPLGLSLPLASPAPWSLSLGLSLPLGLSLSLGFSLGLSLSTHHGRLEMVWRRFDHFFWHTYNSVSALTRVSVCAAHTHTQYVQNAQSKCRQTIPDFG